MTQMIDKRQFNKIIKDYMKSITIEDVITNQVIHNLHDARESKTHVS